jgi:hypothetical protein
LLKRLFWFLPSRLGPWWDVVWRQWSRFLRQSLPSSEGRVASGDLAVTPIFWLLVPGSVGVIGLVATVSGERGARDAEIVAGANLLVQAAAVIIAILIGMQVASLIGQARFWKSQSEREESPVA